MTLLAALVIGLALYLAALALAHRFGMVGMAAAVLLAAFLLA